MSFSVVKLNFYIRWGGDWLAVKYDITVDITTVSR